MSAVTVIGCGYVADFYMRALRCYPGVAVAGAYDSDPERAAAFCRFWDVPRRDSLEAALAAHPRDGIVLNLTNPAAHLSVNRASLGAGCHTYSEKPLALSLEEARELDDLAAAQGVHLASAPCSFLGESAQIMARALREGRIGAPRLIYAELDDGFLTQAPLESWRSESGAPWPYRNEFEVGCTLEHAGYHLSWFIACFGSVTRVVSAGACLLPEKKGVAGQTPDYASATVYFEAGPVMRLTCSILAPRDHSIRIIGDDGVLEVGDVWNPSSAVRLRKRMLVHGNLIELPFGRRLRPTGASHPKLKAKNGSVMNYALGPVEMLEAIAERRDPRMSRAMAVHLNEVVLAVNAPAGQGALVDIQSRCAPVAPMPWGM